MNIIDININELTHYENNAKIHTKEQLEQIKSSILQFGNNDPIAVWGDNNIIVEGHGRAIALKELGYETVECIRLDHLTDEERKAYTLIHNKTTMNTDFDFEKLEQELMSIQDIDMSEFEFDMSFLDEEAEIEEDDFDLEEALEKVEEPKAKIGDIYQLGNHRLMCGDSTNKEDVSKLMNGEKADMVFTDPPYNIAYKGIKDNRTIQNDKMKDEDFIEFLQKSIMVCETAYVCCSWQYEHLFKKAMTNLGMPPKAMIIWNKVNPAQHLDKYYKQHEIIFYYGKFGGEKTLRGDIWECKRKRNTIHPTMKPIELISIALKDNPDKNIIYDGFGGSGSTLITCEQLGKINYTMELDPKYIDVIINRWETLTGRKAELINEGSI